MLQEKNESKKQGKNIEITNISPNEKRKIKILDSFNVFIQNRFQERKYLLFL